ncbi:hypothetical protein [Luteimicrobium subarcticum]|uniref:Ig-like domain-containing protein n=1 Tax=Luteimicrobium subarcticum TaxID=620910 RepID=A0A2M8WTJ3_9MICO|nr:hypothetical protein [Luteimicrobium subarcticum]PJI94272.1 hypothetical protein CLV34_1760 [Luteimicrobium subarcticum]
MNRIRPLTAPLVAVLGVGLAVPTLAPAAWADDAPRDTLTACTTLTKAPVATDADAQGWTFTDTRSAGHDVFVPGGLHVFTDDTSSEAKAAGYHATDVALADAGVPRLDLTATQGTAPGLQLVTDFDGDGTADGILVGEAVYGDDWWVPASAASFVRSAAPSHAGGAGSEDHGTLPAWSAAFPQARVLAVGYSLGSGVRGDATVTGIEAGCVRYTFDVAAPTEPAVPGTLATATPKITGTVRVGATVRVSVGTWTPTAGYTYRWRLDGAPITGATASTYTPTASQYGHHLTVTVTGARDGYTTASVTSAAATVGAGTLAARVPTITGSHQVGWNLRAVPGAWWPSPSFTYQWRRDGVPVHGAVHSSYGPSAADTGHKISVTVTGRHAGYATRSVTSGSITVVTHFAVTHAPTISGTSKVGSTLKAHVAAWSPSASLSYQWRRDGSPVPGAVRSTYRLGTSDHGHHVTVVVTGRRTGYVTTARTSASTSTVAWPSGYHLTGFTTQPENDWVHSGGTATFTARASKSGVSYQWQYTADGRTWHNAPNERGATLRVGPVTTSANDYGFRVAVSDGVTTVHSRTAWLGIQSTLGDKYHAGTGAALFSWWVSLGSTTTTPWTPGTVQVKAAARFCNLTTRSRRLSDITVSLQTPDGYVSDVAGQSLVGGGRCVSATLTRYTQTSEWSAYHDYWTVTETLGGYDGVQYFRTY